MRLNKNHLPAHDKKYPISVNEEKNERECPTLSNFEKVSLTFKNTNKG